LVGGDVVAMLADGVKGAFEQESLPMSDILDGIRAISGG
jgi:hypothetical protein